MRAGMYNIVALSNYEGGMELGEGIARLEYRPNSVSSLIIEDKESEAAKHLDISKKAPWKGIVARVDGDRIVSLGEVIWKGEGETGEQRYSLRGAKYLPKPGQK